MSKILLARFGGIGDTLVLTAVAKCLKKYKDSDSKITLAVRDGIFSLFDNCRAFDDVIPITRQQIDGIDTIPYQDLGNATLELMGNKYDLVIDLKNSIENNVVSPFLQQCIRQDWWARSVNSNFVNWYDLSLSWANIDPTKVADEDKRPLYFTKEPEVKQARQNLMGLSPIGIHMEASSLCRRWYHAGELAEALRKRDEAIMWWNGQGWEVSKGEQKWIINNPSHRDSAALVGQCEMFITVDSGYGHIAEALRVPHITLYTTVPAWTREKYYAFSYPIETSEKCSPCFTLDRICTRQRDFAKASLSDRHKTIYNEVNGKTLTQAQVVEIARKFGTTIDGIGVEWNGILTTLNGASQVEAPCLKAITVDMVLNKIIEIRKNKHET